MVDKLLPNYEKRVEKKEKKKKDKVEDNASVNQGSGGDPPEPPSPYSSEYSCSSSHSHHSNNHQNNVARKSLSKLDVKFNFLLFNGESNAEKLNNWIKQIKSVFSYTKY